LFIYLLNCINKYKLLKINPLSILDALKTPEAFVETMLLDLASFSSIRSFTEEYRRRKL